MNGTRPPRPDLSWDTSRIVDDFPTTRDTAYLLGRLERVPVEATTQGARGPVLEVACGDASRARAIAARGLAVTGLEPSESMLGRARAAGGEAGVTFVRGVAEDLPFRSGHFDRVLCESSLDHFADPRRAIAEMARVLHPAGRLVIGAANYASPAVRLSRVLYRAGRALGAVPPDRRLFWDSPVPHEHTFECSYALLLELCRPHLTLERAVGVSIGWQLPGWGTALGWIPERLAFFVLHRLDDVAAHLPRLGDFVFTVWRHPTTAAP